VVTLRELSPALQRALLVIAQGMAAQLADVSVASSVLRGMLQERGLVRTVRHRDHTRSYALTKAGRATLRNATVTQ
jgi:hypothetical protein